MNLKYEIKVVDEDSNEEVYTNLAYSMESLEEEDHKMQSAIELYKEKTREAELEAEFDRKYEAGDFDDQMILDDDLPDFKDKWISEQNA